MVKWTTPVRFLGSLAPLTQRSYKKKLRERRDVHVTFMSTFVLDHECDFHDVRVRYVLAKILH